MSGWPLCRLWLGNLALLVLTLGLAWPWTRVRAIRFALRYLVLGGPLDPETVAQDAQVATATGDELASFLDTGVDLA